MRLCNYTSILKWYVVEKDSNLSYGQLHFCQEIQSSSIIRLFDNESDLANYLNSFHNEIDWYEKNKLEFLPLKYPEKMLNNLIQSGPPTRYGWRLSMDDDTSNKLNVLLLSSSSSKDDSKPDPIINLTDSSGTLRNIPLLDFIPLVFEYQQTRPIFMDVIKQLRKLSSNAVNL